ncbi:GntR family transcriptional regulator [Clostridium fermenticellae]|uniref:GntR family transcriptional regulator n=1 Tax=Clostridium fermenticellae TaxID=2068654 RepID=A0A386H2U9_9CLOT|nr:GntR family transcriptional regulator [Clostridium fermenticellae]AYD39898.1 GntR family transcriptional regulator [Clostridium fermenticellae]
MLMRLDFESDTPIYIQLKREIIYGIATGQLKEGDSLPSVRHMAEDIGVNMHTVNKTYNLLKADGFVTIDRRKGAIISNISKKPSLDYIENLKQDMKYTIAEAVCKGIDKEDFLKECNELFKIYLGGVKYEK